MKIEVLQEQLLEGVSTTLRAISARVQLPVLLHILLEADSQGITLSATDLELGIQMRVSAKVEETGKITVPAKMLFEFLSSLSPGKVTLISEAANLKVKSGGYSASFQTIEVGEFPQLPVFSKEIGEVSIEEMASAVERVAFASARDSLRPVLTGVLLEFGKGLKLVATDGFRLAIQKVGMKNGAEAVSLLVPARVMLELVKRGSC
jgi:DNA polymerase III subunit beta